MLRWLYLSGRAEHCEQERLQIHQMYSEQVRQKQLRKNWTKEQRKCRPERVGQEPHQNRQVRFGWEQRWELELRPER